GSSAEPEGHASTRRPTACGWQVAARATVEAAAVIRAAQGKAAFLVATHMLDADQLVDQELLQDSKDHHRVQRGGSFLKGPLCLAFSVFVKQPSPSVALSLVMGRCLLV